MARNPTTAETQLEINSTNNSSSILTVDGRYRVTTATPNEIVLSGCSTATGTDVIIYWLTSIDYGSTAYTNIFNAGTYHSRTFNTNSDRALYGSNTSGDIYASSTNLGQAKNNGGSAYYYVYAANIDGNGVWGNFIKCTFSNSVSGVSSNFLTVTWTSKILTPTLSSGSTSYGTWPTSNTTNILESGNKVVLRKDDIAYAIDLNVGSTYSDNIWYATTYNSTTTGGVSGGTALTGNAGRTFTLSANASTARLEASSTDDRIIDSTTEGYYQLYRLWGRINTGTTNPNTTNGKEWDGYYYQKGVTYTVYHPDTGVSVPSSVNIGASDTQANVTVSNISSSDQNGYQWRYNGAASGTYGAGSVTPTSSNLPIITNLPSTGTSRNYNLYVKMFDTNSNSVALHNDWIDTGQVTTVTRASATDTEPDAFDLGPPQTATSGTYVSSYNVTVTGINTTVNWSITNGSFTDVSFNNGATWNTTATSGTLVNNDTIRLRILASSVDRTSTLTIGTGSNSTDTFTVGPGGGGSLVVGGSTATYGLKLKNSSNEVTFNPSIRESRVLAYGSVTPTTATSGYNVYYPGVTTSNNTVYEIVVTPIFAGSQFTVTRVTDGWRIGASGVAYTVNYEIWRIG